MRRVSVSVLLTFLLVIGLSVVALPGAVGAPEWSQVNSDGFGNARNTEVSSMAVFESNLYAGTYNTTEGCGVWRYDGTNWSSVSDPGFGDVRNTACFWLGVYRGRLYAGADNYTAGCGVWRYDGGKTWARVSDYGFGDVENWATHGMSVFGPYMYVGTANDALQEGTGCEVWRYDGGNWAQVNSDGFGIPENNCAHCLTTDGKYLYAGVDNDNGCQVWRYDGAAWQKINQDGFGDPNNIEAHCINFANSVVTVGTSNLATGCQVWELRGGTWSKISADGFGHSGNLQANYSIDYGPYIYIGAMNWSGCELWRYDGSNWEQLNQPGFGDGNNVYFQSMAIYENALFCGTGKDLTGGGEAWSGPLPKLHGSTNWYLAEGSTGTNEFGSFETWVLVQNPGERVADVRLYYQTPEREVEGHRLQVGPHTRMTANVADFVPNEFSVSTRVASDQPVIAERAMYWSSKAGVYRQAAHDSIGVAQAAREWYLAEGSTGRSDQGSFETWILVQNPGDTDANVQLYYQTPSGEIRGHELQLKPHTRRTVNVADFVPNDFSVSTRVMADVPVIAERAMYWTSSAGVYRQAAHDSIGVTQGAREWYLAEGSTGTNQYGSFETWILVQNPGGETANVQIYYQTPTAETAGHKIALAPHTRRTVNVADFVPNEFSVSTRVTSDQPVIAERAMYWTSNGGIFRQAAHDSIGVTQGAGVWYLAEGSTGTNQYGSFETWVLVQNPGEERAEVDIYYQTPDGESRGPHLSLAPHTRQTVNVGDALPGQFSVSSRVTSDKPVIAERAMYWSSGGVYRQAAHDSIGFDP